MADKANKRTDLLDRIDGVWRAWLVAIDTVPHDRLTESGVCGYWSVNDLTAHLAYWETAVLEHIERDRLGLGPWSIDVDAINQQIYLENHDRDPALVRADLFRAHFATVAAINALATDPSKALERKIGDETWDHYPEHTQQVVSWLAGNVLTGDMSPAQISAKYARAVAAGLALFDQVPADQRDQPGLCGVWSARDLLGHLAFWDGYRLSRLEAEMAGNEIPTIDPESDDDSRYDRVNQEQVAVRSEWTWDQVMDEATGVRDRLIEALLVPSAYNQGTAGNHWDLHRPDLESWFAGQA